MEKKRIKEIALGVFFGAMAANIVGFLMSPVLMNLSDFMYSMFRR